MIYVKEATVKGRKVSVNLNSSTDMFVIEADGQTFYGDSIKEVLQTARDGLKTLPKADKDRIAVKFIHRGWEGLRVGTITGRHASTKRWLVSWEAGGNAQMRSYDLADTVAYSPEALTALQAFEDQAQLIECSRNQFIKENALVLPGQEASK